MTTLSVLLVDNQISSAATIVETISDYLTHYELSIVKYTKDAVVETEAVAHIILLRVAKLGDEELNRLSLLSLAYPHAAILLLLPPDYPLDDQALLAALQAGADDFVVMSPTGLLSLGRRLARLQQQHEAQTPEPADLPILAALNNNGGSHLAVQGVGIDNRIHTWNPGAEALFGLPQQTVIGHPIDQLALPRNSIIRLKDILDQARTTGQSFTIDQFPLQDSRDQRRWARVYAHPVRSIAPIEGQIEDVYIFYADVTDFKELELDSKRYRQELFEETQQGLEELSILYEASTVVSTNWNTQEVLNTLIQQIVQAINVSQGFIVNWNRSQSQGAIKASFSRAERVEGHPVTNAGPTFNFTDRPALLTVIKQKRVVLFELSNPSLNEAERADMNRHGCYSRLVIPLIVKGKTIGWAELWETRSGRRFTVDEIRLARMLSIQSAVALENAQYLQQMQQTLEETTALYHVSSTLATTQDPQNIMNIVLQEYLRVLELKQGRVIIFDFNERVGLIRVDVRDSATGRENIGLAEGKKFSLENNPLYEQLMQSRHPVVVDDTDAPWLRVSRSGLDDAAPVKGSWVGEQTLSMLVIPIQVIEDIVGVIIAEADTSEHIFDAWAISLGQAMADQLGIALQNVELYELESKRRHQAETLREVSSAVGSSLNLDEVLERILDQLRRVISYDSAAIHLVEGNRRRIIAVQGFPNPEEVIGQTFPVKFDENEPGSIAIQTRRPFVIGNIAKVDEMFRSLGNLSRDRIKSWLGIPLIARNQVIGLITIDRAETNAFSEEDINLTLAFANQAAIALENARLYEIEVREIERELEIAHEIQETLLPQFAPQVAGLQVSGRTTPVRQIGGDFFHFFTIEQGHFGLAIGDVSGKGMPAALYMAAAMTAIDAEIKNKNPSPSQLLDSLHQILYERLRQNKMNIGLQVATFSPLPLPDNRLPPAGIGRKIMTIANAGMIAPIVAIKTGCHFLSVSGLPLGSPIDHPDYVEDIILMEPETAVIFTSDGIVEAQNERGEMFSFERLEATVGEIINTTNDAEAIAEHIIYKVQEFSGDVENQHDDMTVVVVMVKG